MKKASKKMEKAILKIIKRWTNDLSECDGRDLNGVAITIAYEDEREKEAPARFWDFCTVTVQDVRWDGERNRLERDCYIVCHNGDWFIR